MSKPRDPLSGITRALANPTRWAIFEALSGGDPTTATAIAPLLGLSPSATSWHMRELERAGLIEAAPTESDGRERRWRVKTQRIEDLGRVIDSELSVVKQAVSVAHDDLGAILAIAENAGAEQPEDGRALLDIHIVDATLQQALALTAGVRELLGARLDTAEPRDAQDGDAGRYRITVMVRPLGSPSRSDAEVDR